MLDPLAPDAALLAGQAGAGDQSMIAQGLLLLLDAGAGAPGQTGAGRMPLGNEGTLQTARPAIRIEDCMQVWLAVQVTVQGPPHLTAAVRWRSIVLKAAVNAALGNNVVTYHC
jgi:hypothetical protein